MDVLGQYFGFAGWQFSSVEMKEREAQGVVGGSEQHTPICQDGILWGFVAHGVDAQ